MKKLLIASLLVCAPLFAQNASLSATLTGAAEVPGPGDTDGIGFAVVTINGTTVNYSVLTSNISAPTLAHIHRGAAGVAGPPVVDLNINALSNGTATISQSLANEIAGNPAGFYVNVHTNDFQAGAIRGQLAAAVDAGTRTAYLPVVGKVAGANNTNFVTDLRIINHGGATANITFEYFPQAGGAAVSKTTTVNPGEQKVLDDVVGATLQTTGLGALRVTSDQNVSITARVINDLRANNLGTTGFAVPSSSLEDAKTSGTLSFLASDAAFRTNAGYFNPNSSPVTATFTARRTSDGTVLGTSTITIAPMAMSQLGIFGLIGSVPEADRAQSNFYVTWTATAPLFVYGSVVDNKTGDSVYID